MHEEIMTKAVNLTGHVTSTGNATVLGSFTFAQLNTAVSDADLARTSSTNTFTGVQTFSSAPLIPDDAYGSGWNGTLEPPTKNAVYDKIESLPTAPTSVVESPRPLMPYSGVSTRILSNNVDGYIHMFSLTKQITVNKITLNVTAVDAAGTINIGIFSADGQTRHISVTTASISGTGLVTTSVSAVTLPAGNYYMLLGSVSTASVTFSTWATLSPIDGLRAVSSEPTLSGVYTVTASTMPSTVTLASISSGTESCFTFRLDN
jgi:hypothetical protein